LSIYINGNLAGQTTTAIRPFGPLDPSSNPGLGIGSVQSSNYSTYFHGLISQVKLYDIADIGVLPNSIGPS
jgi:hypothetical protein